MSEGGERVSLELVARLLRDMQAEQRAQRAELRDHRSLLLLQVEQGKRVERRLSELRDELELMLRAEIMGRLGHFEIQMDRRLEELEGRLAALEAERPPPGSGGTAGETRK